ncbi:MULTISPECIES: type VII toxin-antitoxin system HepT family RNase toxin [Thermodesulfovibrio]|jgi:uncharacterized protein YutE (UPF0331/DUF86 family)|uniref:type VII toxin-antitoxin system HepT family RNase toxin n=1 Tax=Thermodesulfovibrio TaxID=28261 RepID=UPI0026244B55|nr:DUF86 domain-containing protein [Thermodesulfovibrio sp.]
MIDRNRLINYISEIINALKVLKEYSKLTKEEFLNSPQIIRDAKYCFIIASQASIDICYHLTAKLIKKAPKDYSNCFEILKELKVFNEQTLRELAIMAKFRNLLVHHYVKVDDSKVFEKLSEIKCFEEFLDQLNLLIKNQPL